MPEYQEIAVQQPEEINMNNEEIKVTEENNEEAYEEQVPTTSEPKVDIYTPPVTEALVSAPFKAYISAAEPFESNISCIGVPLP